MSSCLLTRNYNTFYGIDSSNLIATISAGYNISYTAVQNCFVMIPDNNNYISNREIKLNSVSLGNVNGLFSLKPGDVITCEYHSNEWLVFGVKNWGGKYGK